MIGPLASIASIPSPSFNTIDIGPLHLTLYGLMIGLGIVAATMIARPRLEQRSIHPDTAVEMIVWVVPAGIVGARLYHIITDKKPIGEWIEIWNGGLGIPGAILAGVLAGLVFMKRRNLPRAQVLDALIPGVPLAQAIGRWGNWWNQELYGRPTDLPWGLEIDSPPLEYEASETFHPTFLYESLWNFGLVALLIWIDRRKVLKVGKLIWVYVAVYAIGRLWIEALRIDPATEIFGVRVNLWTMSFLLVLSIFMLVNARRDSSDDPEAQSAAAIVDGEDGVIEGDDEEE